MSAISGAVVSERSHTVQQEPGPDGSAEGVVERLRAAARRFGPAVGMYGVVKLLGFAVFMYLLHSSRDYRHKYFRFGGGHHPWDVLGSWDGWWYQQVAQNGYHPVLVQIAPSGFTHAENSAAFFPLYPGLMRLVSECTGLGLYGAGMLVSVVASFVAAAGIFAVTEKLSGSRKAGVIAAGLWAVFPGSGVEWAVYSDSLFVALASWACYCVMTRRWLTAGVLTFVAGLNRPTASALIAALGIAGLIALYRRKDGIWRPLVAMAIAPVGLFGYVGWVGWKMGSWGGYFTLQRGAWYHFFDYGHYTKQVLHGILTGKPDYIYQFPTEDMIAFAVVIAVPCLLALLFRLRPPAVLWVYALVTILMVLGSQQIFGNVSRYLLPVFPLFVPLAIGMRRLKWPTLVALFAVVGAASGWYAGFVLFELGIP
ncbi:hypothetical protein ABT095_09095 [Kitasatospora sp. NPDC002227]|uniref:hypothetical protein n=1 Tax=Kitasatospora sp. NPDC002227 TaxID=3154773 RepID=UPI003321F9B7